MRGIAFGLAACAILAPTIAVGQDICNTIADHGLYDISSNITDEERAVSFNTWFCRQQFQSEAEANAVGVDVGYKMVNLGYNKSQQSWKQFHDSFCDISTFRSKYLNSTKQYLRTFNTTFTEQVLSYCVGRNGVHVRMESASKKVFRVHVVFKTSDLNPKNPTVVSFSAINARCEPEFEKGQEIGQNGTEILCEVIDTDEDVHISFNATTGVIKDTPLTIKAIKESVIAEPAKTPREVYESYFDKFLKLHDNWSTVTCGDTDCLRREVRKMISEADLKTVLGLAEQFMVGKPPEAECSGSVKKSCCEDKVRDDVDKVLWFIKKQEGRDPPLLYQNHKFGGAGGAEANIKQVTWNIQEYYDRCL